MVEATPALQEAYPLPALLPAHEFGKVLDFLNGRPLAGFDAATEPGNDTLRLADVTAKNIYTSGLHLEPIEDVVADVSDMRHFRLVGMTMKPQEPQLDRDWSGERIVPQIRFIYQLINPRDPEHVFEQLFLHLKWDVVDRLADEATRAAQRRHFMTRLDRLTQAREAGDGDAALRAFIDEFTNARPVHAVSFGSSLTGTWIFGNLERDNATRELRPLRTVRSGIDYGFYSSVYDNDLLRAEIGKASGERKAELEAVLEFANRRDVPRSEAPGRARSTLQHASHALNAIRCPAATACTCRSMTGSTVRSRLRPSSPSISSMRLTRNSKAMCRSGSWGNDEQARRLGASMRASYLPQFAHFLESLAWTARPSRELSTSW